MSKDRSFTEYISHRFYNEIFNAVDQFIVSHTDTLDLHSRTVKSIDTASLSDITIKQVGVDDRPDMRIAFDVILEAEIEVSSYSRYNDEADSCFQWFMLHCTGDLACGLSDFTIEKVGVYNNKQHHEKPLSDSLVPYLYADKTDEAATEFLKKHYPEALRTPMAIDTTVLAERMGLKIVVQQISEDFSVFGQIFFSDADAEVYDPRSRKTFIRHFDAGTIVVDPQTFLLRNLGSVNNTIVHECVHWDRHRKAFELEHLYNQAATQIKCIVVGGIKNESVRSATDWMEWQANTLSPRIQMPINSFKAKANEFIRKYRQLKGTYELVDIIEPVIDELAMLFGVSRSAAKIRMVDIGYEEAVGAFTFIDGQYVKPHAFKKGSLARNQTYSISLNDAIVETLWNQDLKPHTALGDYVYVDAHVCINQPKYVTRDADGHPSMTEYGRLHVDECCLAFTLKVKHANKYGEQFYKECVLYRDANSGLHFEAHFAPESSTDVMAKADALSKMNKDIMELKSKLPMVFSDSLVKIMDWAEITEEELAASAKLSAKTIQRMRTKPDYNVNLKTVIAICIGMHLHPILSQHLIEAAGHTFRYISEEQMMYHFFVTAYYTHSVDECNELLQAKGFNSLSGEI